MLQSQPISEPTVALISIIYWYVKNFICVWSVLPPASYQRLLTAVTAAVSWWWHIHSLPWAGWKLTLIFDVIIHSIQSCSLRSSWCDVVKDGKINQFVVITTWPYRYWRILTTLSQHDWASYLCDPSNPLTVYHFTHNYFDYCTIRVHIALRHFFFPV